MRHGCQQMYVCSRNCWKLFSIVLIAVQTGNPIIKCVIYLRIHVLASYLQWVLILSAKSGQAIAWQAGAAPTPMFDVNCLLTTINFIHKEATILVDYSLKCENPFVQM